MTKVLVSLPEPLKQFIDGLVAAGTFKDSSEYLRTLIESDRQAREKTRVEALLIEGLDSGPSTPMTPDDWEEIEREGQRIVAGRKARKARLATPSSSRDPSSASTWPAATLTSGSGVQTPPTGSARPRRPR